MPLLISTVWVSANKSTKFFLCSAHFLSFKLQPLDDYTLQGLGPMKIVSGKSLKRTEHVKMVVAITRWVIGGLAHASPRTSPALETSQYHAADRPSQSIPNTDENSIPGLHCCNETAQEATL